ncbi:MAG: class I SAM-dependent methyltransferase [Candidatus Nanoarchaeia archaeon]
MKNLKKKTKKTQKRYDKFSRIYDILEAPIEKSRFSRWRKTLLKNLKGNILEIGVGTGKNLEYYGKKAKVTGIDLSPGMLEKAKERKKELGRDFKLIQMDAQNLKFKDNSFNYVISTFVLCSVPDPVKTAKEMKRVCKKNGKILLLEHMLSKYKLIAFFEHIHNPITKTLFGFNTNRKTIENLKKAGLKIKKQENLAFFDVFRKIKAVKQ